MKKSASFKIKKFLINFIPNKKTRKELRKILQKNENERLLLLKLKEVQKLIGKYVAKKHREHYFTGQIVYEHNYWEKVLRWLYFDNYERKNLSILDIGCKYGALAVFSKLNLDADVYTIDYLDDIHPSDLFEKLDIKFKTCNMDSNPKIPYENKFDIIIFTEAIEHFNFNPIPAMKGIKEALNKDGIVYFSTPNSDYMGRWLKYYSKFSQIPYYNPNNKPDNAIDDHIWQYSINEILHVIYSAGLVPVKIEHSFNLHHFNMILKRAEDVEI